MSKVNHLNLIDILQTKALVSTCVPANYLNIYTLNIVMIKSYLRLIQIIELLLGKGSKKNCDETVRLTDWKFFDLEF